MNLSGIQRAVIQLIDFWIIPRKTCNSRMDVDSGFHQRKHRRPVLRELLMEAKPRARGLGKDERRDSNGDYRKALDLWSQTLVASTNVW